MVRVTWFLVSVMTGCVVLAARTTLTSLWNLDFTGFRMPLRVTRTHCISLVPWTAGFGSRRQEFLRQSEQERVRSCSKGGGAWPGFHQDRMAEV